MDKISYTVIIVIRRIIPYFIPFFFLQKLIFSSNLPHETSGGQRSRAFWK